MKLTVALLKTLIKEEIEGERQPNWDLLEKKLLEIGGEGVNHVFEEDLDKLLTRGKAWPTKRVIVNPGIPSQCHVNCAGLYDANEGRAKIVTGWALGPDDETWRQHSWLWWAPKKQLVETTLKRRAYFGFELTKLEAGRFSFENY
jgi:hypothetical protein